jgi:hypothetical protein
MAATYKWRKKIRANSVVIINKTLGEKKIGYPLLKCMRMAELYLLEEASRGLKVKGAQMLYLHVLMEEDVLEVEQKLFIGSRYTKDLQDTFSAHTQWEKCSNPDVHGQCSQRRA